jgi:hypothetical protein
LRVSLHNFQRRVVTLRDGFGQLRFQAVSTLLLARQGGFQNSKLLAQVGELLVELLLLRCGCTESLFEFGHTCALLRQRCRPICFFLELGSDCFEGLKIGRALGLQSGHLGLQGFEGMGPFRQLGGNAAVLIP